MKANEDKEEFLEFIRFVIFIFASSKKSFFHLFVEPATCPFLNFTSKILGFGQKIKLPPTCKTAYIQEMRAF